MSRKPSILFIHQNFPAQFGQFAQWLAQQGWDVTYATERDVPRHPGFNVVKFKRHRKGTEGIHRYLAGTENAIIAGQGFARTGIAMAQKGYAPDIVMAHSGWGVGTFAKDIWPDAKFIAYVEWWYNHPAVDASPFDAQPGEPVDDRARTRIRNTPMLLDLMAADMILCPTRFQADQFPDPWAGKIDVIHDGIDTALNAPGPRDPAFLAQHNIPQDAQIMTYVARGMEPQRGFPTMMQAASQLMAKRPNLHVIVVGEDRVAYGNRTQTPSWKEKMLAELAFDATRLHFTGMVSRADLVRVFRVSDVHLYLSVPFVLSWSALEAMSAGCHIVAADNAPVHEFMTHGRSATLVDPHNVDAVINGIETALSDRENSAKIRAAARESIVTALDAKSQIFPAKFLKLDDLLPD